MAVLAKSARNTAKVRGKKRRRHGTDESSSCSITTDQLTTLYQNQNGLCAVTNQTMSLLSHLNTTISLDRLDDSRGYHIENCRLVCYGVNAARKFEQKDIMKFPFVVKFTAAKQTAAIARDRQRQKQRQQQMPQTAY
jgi:hypothetical protein